MKCLVSPSEDLLVNCLLALNLQMSEVKSISYYELENSRFVVKLEEIPGDGAKHAASLQIHADRFSTRDKKIEIKAIGGEISSVRAERKVRTILEELIPGTPDGRRTLAQLRFMCWGIKAFEGAVNCLLQLGVENVKAAKAQYTDLQDTNLEIYIGHIPNLQTPIPLTRFLFNDKIKVFYPLGTGHHDVWVEWGWRYAFADALTHSIFKRDDAETVFIRGKEEKIALTKLQWVHLIKFMELHLPRKSVTVWGAPRDFKTPEFEYNLRLCTDSLRQSGRAELERLLQEERELRERIEWLRDIESIFKDEVRYNVFFYPLNDPVFPEHFLRRYSISQLSQLRTFYGRLGTLGEGVLVCANGLLEDPPSDSFRIQQSLHPRHREGLVFQTNPHWMTQTGLRVMTPLGLDLFPYLHVDSEDTQAIVHAFTQEVNWGVEKLASGVRKQVATESDLKQRAEAFESDPGGYICLVFPTRDTKQSKGDNSPNQQATATNGESRSEGKRPEPDPQSEPDDKRDSSEKRPKEASLYKSASSGRLSDGPPLEGVLVRLADFHKFEVKITNLGIHFAMGETEKEVTGRDIRETIVANITGRFDQCVNTMRGYLNNSFQDERRSIKEEIDKVDNYIADKRKSTGELKNSLDQAMTCIEQREQLIKRYEESLGTIINRYESLLQRSNRDFLGFVESVRGVLSESDKGFSDILAKYDAETKNRLDFLNKLSGDLTKAVTEIDNLISRRTDAFGAIDSLADFQGRLTSQVEQNDWDRLKIRENIDDLWRFETSLQGLDSFCRHLEEHVGEVRSTLRAKKTHEAAQGDLQKVVRGTDAIATRLGRVRNDLIKISEAGVNPPLILPSQMQKNVEECITVIEECLTSLAKRQRWHKGKMMVLEDGTGHMKGLRARLRKILSYVS